MFNLDLHYKNINTLSKTLGLDIWYVISTNKLLSVVSKRRRWSSELITEHLLESMRNISPKPVRRFHLKEINTLKAVIISGDFNLPGIHWLTTLSEAMHSHTESIRDS